MAYVLYNDQSPVDGFGDGSGNSGGHTKGEGRGHATPSESNTNPALEPEHEALLISYLLTDDRLSVVKFKYGPRENQ